MIAWIFDLLPFAQREPPHTEFSANSDLNTTFFTLDPPCQHNVRMMHSHLDVSRHIFHVESVIFHSVRDTVSNMWKSSSSSQTLCQLQLSASHAALFLFSTISGSQTDLHHPTAVQSISPVSDTDGFTNDLIFMFPHSLSSQCWQQLNRVHRYIMDLFWFSLGCIQLSNWFYSPVS